MITVNIEQLFDPGVSDQLLRELLECLIVDEIEIGLLSDLLSSARASNCIGQRLQAELLSYGRQVLDCSGTGGSGVSHFNTSTSVAFVLAAAGIKVAKFGGRAASSKSGSFDFLERLGFANAIPHESIIEGLEACGLVFILAAGVYPQLQRLAPIRKSIGKRTVLNFIGPLLNPLRPAHRLMGISSDSVRHCVGQFLSREAECQRAMLVTADGRIDELDPVRSNKITHIRRTNVSEEVIDGMGTATLIENFGAGCSRQYQLDASENVEIFKRIVSGEDKSSVFYNSLILNSAAGLLVGGRVDTLPDGIDEARELICSGAVAKKLQQCRSFYGRLS
jgi:anthranilate phosphoribosyltransferase